MESNGNKGIIENIKITTGYVDIKFRRQCEKALWYPSDDECRKIVMLEEFPIKT